MRWTVLAWALFGVYCLTAIGTMWLGLIGSGQDEEGLTVLCVGFALVGAMVAAHDPANPVGWLLLVIGVAFGTAIFTNLWGSSPDLPGATAAGWVSSWIWNVWLVLAAVVLPLVFPDGRLLGPRWRFVVALAVAGMLLSIGSQVITPSRLELDGGVTMPNPTGIDGAKDLASALGGAGNIVAAVCFVLAAASLVLRLRRSRGRARQQVKWFGYVGTLVIAAFAFALLDVIIEALPTPEPGWATLLGDAGWFVGLLGIVIGFPVAIGIAILRHKLYDIDVVINRTLVYGSLTVLLAATYLVSVLAFRVVLDQVTGKSDLAVAASTLAVAALFGPLRSRVQHVVDRRFFRARYDATRTLEGFAAHLRNELDLETLGHDLRDVVAATMQPAHVSLWLRRVP